MQEMPPFSGGRRFVRQFSTSFLHFFAGPFCKILLRTSRLLCQWAASRSLLKRMIDFTFFLRNRIDIYSSKYWGLSTFLPQSSRLALFRE
jgi:hypothetical protein